MPGFPSQPVYTWGVLKLKPEVGYVRILQELHFKDSPIKAQTSNITKQQRP